VGPNATEGTAPLGHDFYPSCCTIPRSMGPDFCPFHTRWRPATRSHSTRCNSGAEPVFQGPRARFQSPDATPPLIVTNHATSPEEILQSRNSAAIHHAGRETRGLRAETNLQMTVDDRIDLFETDNIQHYCGDCWISRSLKFRVWGGNPPGILLAFAEASASTKVASDRRLLGPRAREWDHRLTSLASGAPYICHDVMNDPLFIPGAADARSSLTVPFILHDQVLAPINVEEPELLRSSDATLQFLEIFRSWISRSRSTRSKLLVAQKATPPSKAVMRSTVLSAMRSTAILNDRGHVIGRFLHRPPVSDGDGQPARENLANSARASSGRSSKSARKWTAAEGHRGGTRNQINTPSFRSKRVLSLSKRRRAGPRGRSPVCFERIRCVVEPLTPAMTAVP